MLKDNSNIVGKVVLCNMVQFHIYCRKLSTFLFLYILLYAIKQNYI